MPASTFSSVADWLIDSSDAIRRQRRRKLMGVLTNEAPPKTNVLPSTVRSLLSASQLLIQDLLGNRRQQQIEALSYNDEDDVSQHHIEQAMKKDFSMAAVGFGLAIGGALIAPILYIPSMICTLYSCRMLFKDTYRVYVEERRLDYRAVCALTIPATLAGGYVLAANIGTFFGIFNIYLVARTERRSKKRVADLFGGHIRTVWLLVDGIEVESPFDEVQIGDTVVVHAGQMIPVDGTITAGTSTIDQHMLTGESQPVEKEVGDTVLASTVVLSGYVHISVEKAGNTTVAAQITDVLNQTTDFKRTLESRTDRFMNQITPPILGLSALALPLAGLSSALAILWYYPGIRMMFFGPMSMLSYLQVAAQRGILVKDGRALETLEKIDIVVFDKTGTLTQEQPAVGRVSCYNGMAESDVLRYAAAAEAKQSHPIARAIVQAATDYGLDLPNLSDAHYMVGYGLKVQIEGRTTRVGSMRFMQMEGIPVPSDVAAQQIDCHDLGHSFVLVALDDELAGTIELRPTIRPEAKQIVSMLHQRSIETAIISGDNDAPTRHLAEELGIDRYFAEVLPEDKANLVTKLHEAGHKVCFVGDGINDSIALKKADVAISLRGATTIATDMAEIIFMDGSLGQLPELFELADDFAANMRTNMLAAVLPGVFGIAGTLLFGWGVGICVVLMQTSTPVGIYNSLKPILDERANREKGKL